MDTLHEDERIMVAILTAPQSWSGGPKDLRNSVEDPLLIDMHAKLLGLPVIVMINGKTELRGVYNSKHEHQFMMNKVYDEGRI